MEDPNDFTAWPDPQEPAGPAPTRVELRRPPRVRPGLFVGITAVGLLFLSNVAPSLVAGGLWDALILAVFATLVIPLGLVMLLAKPPGRPVLELGADRIRLPITTRAHEFDEWL